MKSFLKIAAVLMGEIVAVSDNGFLPCQNIEIGPEHIFVNPSTYKCRLCLLIRDRPRAHSRLEARFEGNILALLKTAPSLTSPDTRRLEMDLSNSSLFQRMICERGKSGTKPSEEMKLIAKNAAMPFEREVSKNPFLIGKKEDVMEGVISFG